MEVNSFSGKPVFTVLGTVVCPQYSDVEALILNAMVFEDEAFGR